MWSEEQKALEERKRIEQLRRERDEERQIQDLQRLQEDSGKSRQHNRVDWMYQAPSTATGQYAEEMDGYLLGKRRIDGILLRNEQQENHKPGGGSGVESFTNEGAAAAPLPTVANSRDTMTKVMADPLLEIKKREQGAYEAMVKESVRRGKKLVIGDGGGGGDGASRDRERDRDHDRHKRRRHNSDDDRSRRHHRHRSHRHRSRSSLSPEDDSRHRSYRSRRDERDYHNDRDRRDRDRRDRTRRNERDHRDYSRRDDKDYYKPRDRDDDRRRDSYQRRRSPSHSPRPEPNGHSRTNRDYPDRPPRASHPRRDRSRDRQPNGNTNGHTTDTANTAQKLEEDRARRLAEMQSNATDLEANRRERIAQVTEQEERQREADEKNRSERGRFVGQLHRQLQDDSLDERIRRSKGGLVVEKDDE